MRDDRDCTVLDGVSVIRRGDEALLVRVPIEVPCAGRPAEQRHRDVWIPTRLIHDASDVRDVGDTGALVIPEWLARDRGLE